MAIVDVVVVSLLKLQRVAGQLDVEARPFAANFVTEGARVVRRCPAGLVCQGLTLGEYLGVAGVERGDKLTFKCEDFYTLFDDGVRAHARPGKCKVE